MAIEGMTAHDPDAEFRVIAAIFFDPSLATKVIGSGITSESFYKSTHRLIFAGIEAAAARGEEPDEIAVEQALVESGDFESVGGRQAINLFSTDEKLDPSAAAAQWRHYVSAVAKCADQRMLTRALMKARELADSGDVDGARRTIAEIPVPEQDFETNAFADWQKIFAAGMERPKPTIVKVDNGPFLLYEGRMNEGHGEHSVGKTNVCCAIIKAAVDEGKKVLYIDPEDVPEGLGSRLESFGMSREKIASHVVYSQFEPDLWSKYYHRATRGDIDIVIFDGIAEGMAAHGLKEREEDSVLEFFRKFRPFKKAGITLFVTDHVVKDGESRGLWSRGSGAKLAHYDGASYYLETGKGYTPTESGFVRLKIAKDRNGGVGKKGQTIAEMRFDPHEMIPGRTEVRIIAAEDGFGGGDAEWRPTALMAKVEEYVSANPGAPKRDLNHIGKTQYVSQAIQFLIEEGRLRTEPGERNSTRHFVVEQDSQPQPE